VNVALLPVGGGGALSPADRALDCCAHALQDRKRENRTRRSRALPIRDGNQ
jgi:hypothetical protein